jgi:hypothetical protein
MAKIVKYVRMRGNVYWYERRVPQSVMRDAAAFRDCFDDQKLFRRSLKTRRSDEVLAQAEVRRLEYEDRLRRAVGLRMPSQTARAVQPRQSVELRRAVTSKEVEGIRERQRN